MQWTSDEFAPVTALLCTDDQPTWVGVVSTGTALSMNGPTRLIDVNITDAKSVSVSVLLPHRATV